MKVRSLFLLLAQSELKRRKTITCSFVFFARVNLPRFCFFFFFVVAAIIHNHNTIGAGTHC
jgi:hypothetical protein